MKSVLRAKGRLGDVATWRAPNWEETSFPFAENRGKVRKDAGEMRGKFVDSGKSDTEGTEEAQRTRERDE